MRGRSPSISLCEYTPIHDHVMSCHVMSWSCAACACAAASRKARESEPRRSDDLAELIQRRAAAAANDAGRMRPPLVLVLSAAAATPPLADAAPITCQPLRAFPGAADFPTYHIMGHVR
eukprot:COSAG06_NODE_114_length_23375_cov_20.304219_19_plen_119_part_00